MPFSGPMKLAPRCLRISTFATVAGCIHIFPFIAGASSSCASVASTMDVKASSATFWLRFCWRHLEAGPPIRQNGRAGHAGRIFLVLRNPATADCGILVLRRINLGEVFRFDKMPSFRPSAGICFLMYAGAAGICGGFLCQWVVERETGSAGRYDHL